MKITFFLDTFPALAQSYVLNQITGMIDRGHDVTLWAMTRGDTQQTHPAVNEYKLLQRVHYAHPPVAGKLPRLAHALRSAAALLPTHPRQLLAALSTKRYGPTARSLQLLKAFHSFAPQFPHHADIIHCHFGPLGQLAACLRDLNLISGKITTVFHGYDLSMLPRTCGNDYYQFLFKHGDIMLPISQHWQNRLIELNCPADKINVHHMGICPEAFPFTPRQRSATQPVKFLTVARLTEKKGITYALQALAAIKPRHSFHYDIIGNGPLHQSISQQIADLGLSDRVNLLGWRNHQQLLERVNQYDIMLAPSVTASDGDQEGIPVSIMEAMALGMPIIATHHSGIGELVTDQQSGLLVNERDPHALAQALLQIIQHRHDWPAMGQAARQKVQQEFNIHLLNDQLQHLFSQLITR